MAKKDRVQKTNALREIEAAGIAHRFITFECEEALSGVDVAATLGEDPDRVFKTLVTEAKSGQHYVFMVPVACELDLKKAAAAVGEKAMAEKCLARLPELYFLKTEYAAFLREGEAGMEELRTTEDVCYGILAAMLALRADRAPAEREHCAGALRDLLAACRRFPEHVPHADELQALFDRNELLACYFS